MQESSAETAFMLPEGGDRPQERDTCETMCPGWSTLPPMGAMILLSVLAGASLAGATPLPGDVAFNEGLQLLEDFEYEKAIFRFREAVRDPTKTPEQRAICHIYVGVTLAELREDADAIAAFEEAVKADPAATLPLDASPKVKEMLRTARANVAAAGAPVPGAEPTPALGDDADRLEDQAPPSGEDIAPPPTSDGGGVIFLASGGALAGAGVLALAGAGGLFVLALNLNQQAQDAEFADDAAAARDSSLVSQIGAGALVGTGALLVAGGAALLVFGFLE